MQNKGKSFSINEKIKALEVRLIDQDANMIGIISTQKALQRAEDAGMDLIEVSPNVKPPVCKIGNFGKMRYEMQKKAADAKKRQKVVDVKEIKMSFNIGRADYMTKVSKIEKFIKVGNKVKVSMRMRGREITHVDIARDMINEVVELVKEYAKPEINPKLEGMQLTVTFVEL